MARRSGLSEPTLRYYEEVGLIGPIARDESSGHRRYRDARPRRAAGARLPARHGRRYRRHAHLPGQPRARARVAAGEQRDLLLRHAERIEAEIETLQRPPRLPARRRRPCGTPATAATRRDEAEARVRIEAILPSARGGDPMSRRARHRRHPATSATRLIADAAAGRYRGAHHGPLARPARPRCARPSAAAAPTTTACEVVARRPDGRRRLGGRGGRHRGHLPRRLADDPERRIPDEVIVPAREGTLRVLARRPRRRRPPRRADLVVRGGRLLPQAGRATTPRRTGPTRTPRACRPTRGRRRSPSAPRGTSSSARAATPSWL